VARGEARPDSVTYGGPAETIRPVAGRLLLNRRGAGSLQKLAREEARSTRGAGSIVSRG
jgi:hypothetical protein